MVPPETGKVFSHRVRASAGRRGPDQATVVAVAEKPVGCVCLGDLVAGTQRVSFIGTRLLSLGPVQSFFFTFHTLPHWFGLSSPSAAAHSEIEVLIGGEGTFGHCGISGCHTAGRRLQDFICASFGAPKFNEKFWKGCPCGLGNCLTEPAFFAGARFEVRAAHRREAAAVESDVLGDKRASSVLVVNVGWRNV